jgi:leucyl/phenylalanyl-tRNA--protein transferase
MLDRDDFPPSSSALDDPNGLLAVGGDLSAERLLQAYRRGIFPWYEEPQPIMWWTPDPRSVLWLENLHVSRSLRRTLRRDHFRLSVDQRFREVMMACAGERTGSRGTWIGTAMLAAYCRLHGLGYAHSIEVLDVHGELVGGLYGVAIGGAFFGESMFSRRTDASKVALVALVMILRRGGFTLIDCQVESDHLNSMGAKNVRRLDFEETLAQTTAVESDPGIWTLPATCGGLL